MAGVSGTLVCQMPSGVVTQMRGPAMGPSPSEVVGTAREVLASCVQSASEGLSGLSAPELRLGSLSGCDKWGHS